MTVYALRLENGKDTAARVRMADLLGLAPSGNLSARSGIRPGPTAGVVAVTAGTMQVTVQPFMAWVDGGVSDTQGGYPFVSDAVVTLTLANGHGTLSRTDVIAAVVRDSGFDSSGTLSASVEVVQGTPGAGAPALPTNAVALRNIVVPAGASAGTGGLTSGALSTDRRQWLAGLGGVTPVVSATERNTLPTIRGAEVYRLDTDELEVRHASGWRTVPTSSAPPSDAGNLNITAAGPGSPQAVGVTVQPGSWVVYGKGQAEWADAAGVENAVILYDATGSTELDRTHMTLPTASGKLPWTLMAVVTVTTASTIQLRAWTGATGTGTQLQNNVKLVAQRATV